MFHQLWKGLGTYNLFISVATPTHSVHTVIGLLCGPDQTFHRLHGLGHWGMWPRGNKVFLSARWVWWKLYKLFLLFFFFLSRLPKAVAAGKQQQGKWPVQACALVSSTQGDLSCPGCRQEPRERSWANAN